VSAARLGATVPLTIGLTLAMGVTGAALGITLGYAVQLAVQVGVLRAHLSQPMRLLWPARQLVGLVAAYAGGYGAAWGLDSTLPGIVGVVAGLAGGALAYGLCLLLVGGFLPRDRARASSLIRRVAPDSKWATRVAPRPQPSI
jgi:hypothetical protein